MKHCFNKIRTEGNWKALSNIWSFCWSGQRMPRKDHIPVNQKYAAVDLQFQFSP